MYMYVRTDIYAIRKQQLRAQIAEIIGAKASAELREQWISDQLPGARVQPACRIAWPPAGSFLQLQVRTVFLNVSTRVKVDHEAECM